MMKVSKALGSPKAQDEMPAILDLRESQLPQLKGWKIGGKYKVVLDVEMISQGKGYDGEGAHRASFKVLSARSAGESKAADATPDVSRKEKLDALKDKAGEA